MINVILSILLVFALSQSAPLRVLPASDPFTSGPGVTTTIVVMAFANARSVVNIELGQFPDGITPDPDARLDPTHCGAITCTATLDSSGVAIFPLSLRIADQQPAGLLTVPALVTDNRGNSAPIDVHILIQYPPRLLYMPLLLR